MPKNLIVFLSLFLILYGLSNFYVGLRSWQAFRSIWPLAPVFYWLLYGFLALAFLLGRFFEKHLPFVVSHILTIIGSYWLAALYYLLLIIIVLDMLRLLDRVISFIPSTVKQAPTAVGLSVLIFTAGLLGYGIWNARHPIIQHYDIVIPKSAGSLSQLHIVMISDIHLGKIVDLQRLEKLIDTVNELQPDIILLPGDTIDEDVDLFEEQQMPAVFLRLHPIYGTYAVLGNHEYIGGKPDLAIQSLKQGGVIALRDSSAEIAGSLYIVGRDDKSIVRTGKRRKKLVQIMKDLDPAHPVIVLDHQPSDLQEAAEAGIDLQLSGHTHLGQMFPNNLITHKVFEVDWGYLQKGPLQVIVSCGFGTWGPPIRIGNKPEIVDINITFRE